ncbi:hypothetical protein B0H66DRAFT_516242 [Apodospora peruviana]|uniref:Alpha/beta hydrolase fold-3 domain-containing protein n=1 Tax=Apodospora peruviana TaxID=516989 RepID=A0AAE0I493_9PEZI|nr:hypothetical protein B0H66DRAFT_516242 [Apodospora peruviana]
MPSYEPTPRRFSIISVSRSTSRRNSIDGANHLSLPVNDAPEVPPLLSPMDLTGTSKYIQHIRDVTEVVEGEAERGRSRQSTGHRRTSTSSTWNQDVEIQIPFAKRDNSASTRERIAVWEQRSRSQSMGRSKSRGRDLGAGSRISVVPEVPEIPSDISKTQLGTGQVGDMVGESSASELDAQSQQAEDLSEPELGDNYTVGNRPLTPVGVSQAFLPTPDATPKTVVSNKADIVDETDPTRHADTKVDEQPESLKEDAVKRPLTPVHAANPPLTPEATPDQTFESTRRAAHLIQHIATSPLAFEPLPAPVLEENEGKKRAIKPQLDSPPVMVEHFHLPSNLLSDAIAAEPEFQDQTGPRTVPHVDPQAFAKPALPPRPIARQDDQEATTNTSQSRYHDVWKITDYEPEFPLPSRPTVQATLELDILARTRFDGNPLQELPRTQLSAAAAPYRPPPDSATTRPPDSYPYSTHGSRGPPGTGGDWVVNIPPSPTSAYIPEDRENRPLRQTRPRSRSRTRGGRGGGGGGGGRYTSRGGPPGGRHEWDAPPVIERAFHAASVSMIQGLTVPMGLYRGLRDIYYPPPERPDIIKAYPVRRRLPVRVFFPSHYDLTSPALLPTIFTLHGGGFTVGYASDDDMWNRTFADSFTILVISLNYSKAPWVAFPTPLHDAEALYHAVLNDESLPIDRMRTALCGFDAGANLALALAQLPSVKTGRDPNPAPTQQLFFLHAVLSPNVNRGSAIPPTACGGHLHLRHPRLHHLALAQSAHETVQAIAAWPTRLGARTRLDGSPSALERVELHPVRARRVRSAAFADVRVAGGSAAARVRRGGRARLPGPRELARCVHLGGQGGARPGCAGRTEESEPLEGVSGRWKRRERVEVCLERGA